MKHTLPVACWLRWSSPLHRVAAAENPVAMLDRMEKVCNLVSLLWWGMMVQLMFWCIWHNPACFWYVVPLCMSAGIVGYGWMGQAAPSEDFLRQSAWLWDDPQGDEKWPREYALYTWQLELAWELVGDRKFAQLQAEAMDAMAPSASSPAPSKPRL